MAPPPASTPNATPLLRTFVMSSTPPITRRLSPSGIELRTIALVSWSSASTAAATSRTRTHPRLRTGTFASAAPSRSAGFEAKRDLPLDQAHHDPTHDDEDEH